jgi:hypothetical protein
MNRRATEVVLAYTIDCSICKWQRSRAESKVYLDGYYLVSRKHCAHLCDIALYMETEEERCGLSGPLGRRFSLRSQRRQEQ